MWPIGPGEELLVWYSGEDNPEITAALEEEKASSLCKKNSPRAKRARGKLVVRARQTGWGGFRGPKRTGGTQSATTDMWDTEDGPNEEERQSSPGPSQEAVEPSPKPSPDSSLSQVQAFTMEEKQEVEQDEGPGEPQQPVAVAEPEESLELPDLTQSHSTPPQEEEEEEEEEEEGGMTGVPPPQCNTKTAPFSVTRPEPKADPDPDLDLEGDAQDEAHPCQHCERHFSTKQGLERHIHIHATVNQQTHAFKCRYCGKSFGSQVGRRRHERRHENVSKKRPGSLAGTATLLSPRAQVDGSSPDRVTASGHHVVARSPFQIPATPLPNSEMVRKDSVDGDRPFIVDENGESKELHPCKYCNKAFGTHTNMRRHQRRIHERHLLPKGVRRKGMLLQESPTPPQQPDESPSTSPPLVYVPSADTEDEADRDDYVVDISKNISENLSLYIDGKILSTSSVSSCDVIEVDSSSAALFGLDTVILSPSDICQALKVDTRTGSVRQVSNFIGQSTSKRRTSTPPLMPGMKMETDTGNSSTSSSCSTSSSSTLLMGGLFQKEKTIYLSPKLKQLLQTQDSHKPTITLITDSHTAPVSVTSLPGGSGRFKRRTASPPSSPHLSPALKGESARSEAGSGSGSSYTLKVPKLENLNLSTAWSLTSKDDRETMSPSGKDTRGWPASSSSGGNSCNQQPLDLSSSVGRRNESSNKASGESVLDLSIHRKSGAAELESKGIPTAIQPPAKKKKPNTSMLEKVLMSEYGGLTTSADDGSLNLGSPDSQYTAGSGTGTCSHSTSPNIVSDSANPSPPSLTPVTMNPSSPSTSLTCPTPPPPVLPTIPSPQGMPSSPHSQPSDCSTFRSLPVLSPKMSPTSVDHGDEEPSSKPVSDTEETSLGEDPCEDELMAQSPDPTPDPVRDLRNGQSKPSPREAISLDLSTTEPGVAMRTRNGSSLLNGKVNKDTASVAETKSQHSDLSVLSESLSGPSASPPALSDRPSPPVIKKEPRHADTAHGALPPVGKPTEVEEQEDGGGDAFSKSFVCNVCDGPFRSIKELSRHIVAHAADWPYKCEFCVQLFGDAAALLEHRTALHGVGRIFVCSACRKEFAFLCNLQQHQTDLHPNQECTHAAVESGKLRPQNYTDPGKATEESSADVPTPESSEQAQSQGMDIVAEEEPSVNGKHGDEGGDDPTEELYTTIKIMASEGGKPKGPDVRLGINQHYPSFKPPPFPYHNRTHATSVASATNFTTHNIPQTFSTAIRCTKCGNSFDNMPELHKHILACANASDKRRYTPKKNPIPLRQIVKPQNGVLSPAATAAVAGSIGQNAFRRMGQPKRLNFNQEATGKTRMTSLSKKKNQLVQKAITQRNKSAASVRKTFVKVEEEEEEPQPAPPQQEVHVCPHCSREFTYPASLSKHIAVSCPMKPAAKKGKRGAAEAKRAGADAASDKNMSLRRRATDTELQQPEPGSKPLRKTRARSSGAPEAEPPQATKGKAAGRPKRPASFPAAVVPPGKKGRKGHAQSLPPTPSSSDVPTSEPAPRPAGRMGRVGKEVASKKVSEGKSPQEQSQTQVKKEVQGERFSLRARERAGGPVTRSLQLASFAGPVEVKTEELSSQEPKDPKESLQK
ncbi:PR domain zinc finger protein 2 [Hypomesus transpacificus]|uniref:PR domain zinc finger protein 2 n=1 Tax=Hypomesus transpacificus TaxID=137520 RepID=UPI001F08052E|nr:PR domain zinc finger protein 2 [Hypomesus transpacificus]